MEENNNVLKGTTTVGIKCQDGIVLAADKRATAGHLVVNKKTDKVYSISKNIALTMAGTVSDAQLLSKLIKAELNLKRIRSGREATVKETANLLAGMVYGNIRKPSMIPGVSHFLLGGKDDTGFYLYDIFADGSLTQEDEYITSGSGSVMAFGVLETLYKPNMPIAEGVSLAIKSVNAALQRDSATGNGLKIITITEKGIEEVFNKEIQVGIKE
jgi:proteasome beta subunit